MRVTVDTYTRLVLTAITVLLTVLALGLWYQSPSAVAPAQGAGIPDAGMQTNQVLDRLTSIDASLAELKTLLVSGAVKVQVIDTKEAPAPAPAAPPKAQP